MVDETTTDLPDDDTSGTGEDERRRLHEVWATGTEVPDWVAASTAEGAQSMVPREHASSADLLEEAGARAMVSSIHVNGWFGDYDKLAMTRIFFREVLGLVIDEVLMEVVFCGDSPNDAPLFGHFPHAVGVANLSDFAGRLPAEPRWIASRRGGDGFAELAEALLQAR